MFLPLPICFHSNLVHFHVLKLSNLEEGLSTSWPDPGFSWRSDPRLPRSFVLLRSERLTGRRFQRHQRRRFSRDCSATTPSPVRQSNHLRRPTAPGHRGPSRWDATSFKFPARSSSADQVAAPTAMPTLQRRREVSR